MPEPWYFHPYRLAGPCGTLAAENGVLEASDGRSRRLPAPVRGDDATISGDGWTFKAAAGLGGARRRTEGRLRSRPAAAVSGTRLHSPVVLLALVACVRAARRWISAEWGTSDNNRRARFYTLTRVGRTQLAAETRHWRRLAAAIGRILGPEGA